MKRYILALPFILFIYGASAQTKAISFSVNGLKVILRPTQKETVSMGMFFKGGVMNYGPKQAGIENLALATAAICGTKNHTVTDYKELEDEYGIGISGSSTTDYGTIRMNCISKYLDEGWKLFADAIVNPTFDNTEFQNTKEKMISAISQSYSSPERRLEQISMEALFLGTPYSINPMGSKMTLDGFTADSIKNYYHKTLLNKERMFLVVAGNISKQDLEKKISAAFATLPSTPYTPPVYTQKVLEGEHLYTEQRDIATNYMSCVMNAPTMSNPDYAPFMLAINVLSGSLNYEIRTKQGLSYAPGAKMEMQQMPYTSMYVSTTQPKKAFQAMVSVYSEIRAGHYSQGYLDMIKKNHKSRYYTHQESATSIVKDLGEAEVLGDYKMEEDKIANINKVTLQGMNAAFNKYLKGAIWVYLGDEQLGKAAFQ